MKGKSYVYFENMYIEKNKPYIPISIRFNVSENIGDVPVSIYEYTKDNKVEAFCLLKDVNLVGSRIKIENGILECEWKYYLGWLHDGLMDMIYDAEFEKRSIFPFVQEKKDTLIHRVVHFILDNIDKYYVYFMKTDCEYYWLYDLYNDAKDGVVTK